MRAASRRTSAWRWWPSCALTFLRSRLRSSYRPMSGRRGFATLECRCASTRDGRAALLCQQPSSEPWLLMASCAVAVLSCAGWRTRQSAQRSAP
eukprot:8896929-Lingulodinium_polyedra.AAC.1